MNRHVAFALIVVAAWLSGGCDNPESTSVGNESQEAEIRQADQALLRAEEQRNLDDVMDFIAPHAVFHPPGHAPIVGHEAIRRFYETQWFKVPFIEISGTLDSVVVGSSGDLAYCDGRSHMVIEISGERTVASGKYLGVWQKISGTWKLAAISWSANEATG